MTDRNRITDILKEYDEKYDYLELFRSWFSQKLDRDIESSSLAPLITENRIKEKNSLKKKLEQISHIKSLKSIEDLIGFRVVFSLEKETHQFVQFLFKKFGIDSISYRPRFSEDAYNADHLIITIKKRHAKGSKSIFVSQKVEVQVTSNLYYQWTRTTHDILYKDKYDLKAFNPRLYKQLEEKFTKIMVDYIKPATHQLDILDENISKAKTGKQIQSVENYKRIKNEFDIYSLYSNLIQVKETLKTFGDCSSKKCSTIALMENTIEKIIENKIKISTEVGFEITDLIRVVLDILGIYSIKWSSPVKVFNVAWLFVDHENEYIRKNSKELILKLCEFRLDILNAFEFNIQWDVLNALKKVTAQSEPAWEVMVEAICKLGQLELDASYMKGDTFVIRRGTPNVTKKLKSLRTKAIVLFFERIVSCPAKTRINLYKKLHNFFWTHPNLKPTPELKIEINRAVAKILKIYESKIDLLEITDLVAIHKDLSFYRARFPSHNRILNSLEKKITSRKYFNAINDILPGDEISYYKTEDLNRHLDRRIKQSNYEQQLKDLKMIGAIISKFEKTEQIYIVNGLCAYVERIGETRPNNRRRLLKESLNPRWVNYALVLGAVKRGDLKEANIQLNTWVKRKENLERCITLLGKDGLFQTNIATKLFFNLKGLNRIDDIKNLGFVTFVNNEVSGAKQLCSDICSFLEERDEFFYVNPYHINWEKALQAAGKKLCKKILMTYVLVPYLHHDFDQIIAQLSKNNPDLALNLFDARIRHEESIKDKPRKGGKEVYEAIPYEFYWTKQVLEEHSNFIIPRILNWAIKNKDYFYSCSKLIVSVWNEDIEFIVDEAISAITGKSKRAKHKMFSFFNFIENKSLSIAYVERFVTVFRDWESFESELFILAGKHGVVMGDDGFLKAHESDLEIAREKINTSSGRLKRFWKKFSNLTQKDASLESRRVERHRVERRIFD